MRIIQVLLLSMMGFLLIELVFIRHNLWAAGYATGSFLVYLFICFLCYLIDRKKWNKGICKESGMPWILFDTDSQLGRMYKDNACHYADISWPVDKKRGKK